MKIYCINLYERPNRWKQVQKEAKKLKLPIKRFSAFKRDWGHEGCKLSHLTLLDAIKHEGIFMVIEDDMRICIKDPIQTLEKAIQQLPSDWDMLYLGATLTKPIKRYSHNLFELKGGLTCHAIIYNNQNEVADYILKNHDRNRIDPFYSDNVQENFNCFITYPMIATQRAGKSDLLNKYTSYKEILKSYKKYTNEIL